VEQIGTGAYFEISALTGKNVDKCFEELIRVMLEHKVEEDDVI